MQLTKKNLSFIEAGVDINIQGREQPHKCLSRWLKIHRAYGPNGLLQENRGVNSNGRPNKKELSIEEKYEKTLKENINVSNVLLHSAQGFHYTNPEYRMLLKENNIIQSMSRKGNCIDNASMESFLGHLKDEVDYKNCKTFDELAEKIDEYMYYYNNERYQWSRNKMTPVQNRSHLLIAS